MLTRGLYLFLPLLAQATVIGVDLGTELIKVTCYLELPHGTWQEVRSN